jgi:hypothetical protein
MITRRTDMTEKILDVENRRKIVRGTVNNSVCEGLSCCILFKRHLLQIYCNLFVIK